MTKLFDPDKTGLSLTRVGAVVVVVFAFAGMWFTLQAKADAAQAAAITANNAANAAQAAADKANIAVNMNLAALTIIQKTQSDNIFALAEIQKTQAAIQGDLRQLTGEFRQFVMMYKEK